MLGTLAAVVIVGMAANNGEVSLAGLAVGQLGLWAGLLGFTIRATYRKGSRSLAEDFGLAIERADLWIGVVVGLASQLALVPLIYLPLKLFSDDFDLSKPAKELADQAHGVTFVAFAIVVVVGAPVVEELFFRGLVLRAFQRRFGNTWAVVGSSLAFGVAHFEGLQLPALVAFGAILAVAALRYGRLGPGMIAHAVFNALAVVSLYSQR